MKFDDMLDNVSLLDVAELRMLASEINRCMKAEREVKTIRAKDALRVGMTVHFVGNKRNPGPHCGELIKINRVNGKVRVGFVTWTVPLASLVIGE
tara:strand:+ start:158 stop:442 length:285 start_codon:yes stop_codon:yes gene_type:complete